MMKSNSDSTVNPRKRNSTVLSTENDSASYKKHKLVPPPASSIQKEQSNDAVPKSNNKSLNENSSINSADDLLAHIEDLIASYKKLQGKNGELKVKQAANGGKTNEVNEIFQAESGALKYILAKANFSQLEEIGECMHDKSKLISVFGSSEIGCFKQEQCDEAIAGNDKAIELEKATLNRPKKLSILYSNKAACFVHLKQYQQCIDAATTALDYNSDDKYTLNTRAVAYYKSGRFTTAIQDLEKALQLDTTFELARNNLGVVKLYDWIMFSIFIILIYMSYSVIRSFLINS